MCIADFEALAERPERLRRSERELLARCDVAFAHSDYTLVRCRRFASRVELIPPSVNLDRFKLAGDLKTAGDEPVVGYVGGLHRFVDVELIAECAKLRPGWRWKLIGPTQTDLVAIAKLANVELVGPRPHEELGDLIAGFDACVVPYRTTPGAESIAPTKINEYLAVGRPVAATDLPWVKAFGRRNGAIEIAPAEPEAFIDAIARALRTAHDADASARRREVAMRSSWQTRLEDISRVLEGVAR